MLTAITISDSILIDFSKGFPRQFSVDLHEKRVKALVSSLEADPDVALLVLETENVSWLLHVYVEGDCNQACDKVRKIVSELPC